MELNKTVPNTDNAPAYYVLALEGTAADTLDVTLWAKAEQVSEGGAFGTPEAASARRFYKISATTTLTVGTAKTLAAVQGPIYVQTGAIPAHDCTLRIGVMAAPIP